MYILNWHNLTGVHCGSVAIRNVANYYGVNYEEALCFGLGSGMGFFYSKNKEGKPSEVIHLRAPNMEPNFFSNSNLKYEWIRESDFNIAENKLIQDIKNGFPVFLQTDIFFLHYYNSPIHFPGHVIVCIGVDEKRKVFYVSDTNFKEIQEISFSDMRMARSSKAQPYPLYFNHFKITNFSPFRDLKEKIEKSILYNSYNYITGQKSERGISSIFTILEWINNLERWKGLKDSSETFKFAYQIIVKRGSKGAGFRYIYKDFLQIAEKESKKVKKLNLVDDMEQIAENWNNIGLNLRSLSKRPSKKVFNELIDLCQEVFNKEYLYHSKILDSFGDNKKGA